MREQLNHDEKLGRCRNVNFINNGEPTDDIKKFDDMIRAEHEGGKYHNGNERNGGSTVSACKNGSFVGPCDRNACAWQHTGGGLRSDCARDPNPGNAPQHHYNHYYNHSGFRN